VVSRKAGRQKKSRTFGGARGVSGEPAASELAATPHRQAVNDLAGRGRARRLLTVPGFTKLPALNGDGCSLTALPANDDPQGSATAGALV
jgi:hypothetical protein